MFTVVYTCVAEYTHVFSCNHAQNVLVIYQKDRFCQNSLGCALCEVLRCNMKVSAPSIKSGSTLSVNLNDSQVSCETTEF